jgi:hypothetical protein
MKIKRQPLLIFYLLVAYIFASFTWWIFFLVRLSTESYHEKKELTELNYHYQNNGSFENSPGIQDLEAEYKRKISMIIGEGSVS